MLVLFAVAATALMVLAALAVDLGNIAQRHQLAADAAQNAALVGAQMLGTASSESTVVGIVESALDANDAFAPPPGSPAWDDCGDATIPSGFAAPSGSGEDCITFATLSSAPAGGPPPPPPPGGSTQSTSDGPNVVHVVVPPELVDYTLGRAGGLSSATVGSHATAVTAGSSCASSSATPEQLLAYGGTEPPVPLPGSTVALDYIDETPYFPCDAVVADDLSTGSVVIVNLDRQPTTGLDMAALSSLDPSITPGSGPNAYDTGSNAGLASPGPGPGPGPTSYEETLHFTLPANLTVGDYRVTVTSFDSDGNVETVTWSWSSTGQGSWQTSTTAELDASLGALPTKVSLCSVRAGNC